MYIVQFIGWNPAAVTFGSQGSGHCAAVTVGFHSLLHVYHRVKVKNQCTTSNTTSNTTLNTASIVIITCQWFNFLTSQETKGYVDLKWIF